MIIKERLEELIEQGATVYEVKYNNINPVLLTNKIRFISDKNKVIAFEPRPNEKYKHHKYFKNLFETREEAEWHKEFGCIERTERLELPTWEETIDLVYSGSFGVQTIIKFDKCKFGYKLQLDGNVYIFVDKGTDTLFMGSLTKENYTLACRKCKEIFLGENK